MLVPLQPQCVDLLGVLIHPRHTEVILVGELGLRLKVWLYSGAGVILIGGIGQHSMQDPSHISYGAETLNFSFDMFKSKAVPAVGFLATSKHDNR